jgi:hypothetical protein
MFTIMTTKKKTPWLLVCKRTVLTERPSLVGEFWYQLLQIEGVSRGQCSRTPTAINLSFIDWSYYLSSSSILTRLSGLCSRLTPTEKSW